MFIYRLIKYVSSLLIIPCVLIFGYYAYKAVCMLIKKKFSYAAFIDDIQYELENWFGQLAKPLLIVALVSALLTNAAFHQIVGIHNLKLKPAGTYSFYVKASRLSGKTYTVPAEVRIGKETVEVGDNKEREYTYFYIERIFFTNGKEIKFETWDSVEINETTFLTDSKGVEWKVTLLNKHAYLPQIKETNNANWLEITILVIEVLSSSFLLFAMCYQSKRELGPEDQLDTEW